MPTFITFGMSSSAMIIDLDDDQTTCLVAQPAQELVR